MSYRPLQIFAAQTAASFPPEKPARPEWLESDRATLLMTDFRDGFPPSIDFASRLGDASIEMQRFSTGTMLAIDGGRITGIITIHDIHGPKPVQFLHDIGCHRNCQRQNVTVADVMTPVEQLPAVRLSDLQLARIGDIRKTFDNATHTHLVVLDVDASTGAEVICGMIDGNRLERDASSPRTADNATMTRREPSSPESLLSY